MTSSPMVISCGGLYRILPFASLSSSALAIVPRSGIATAVAGVAGASAVAAMDVSTGEPTDVSIGETTGVIVEPRMICVGKSTVGTGTVGATVGLPVGRISRLIG